MITFGRIAAPLLGGALFLSLAASASAHAHFVSSTPAPGSSATTAPASLTITFDDNLDKNATKIAVTGPNGSTVSGATAVSASNTMVASTTLSGNGNGVYTVNWHSVADDDKGVVDGSFSFGVGVPASAVPKTGGDMPGSWPLATGLGLVGLGLLGGGIVVRRRASS